MLVNLAAFCWPGKSGKASVFKYSLTNAGVWLPPASTRVRQKLTSTDIKVDFESGRMCISFSFTREKNTYINIKD